MFTISKTRFFPKSLYIIYGCLWVSWSMALGVQVGIIEKQNYMVEAIINAQTSEDLSIQIDNMIKEFDLSEQDFWEIFTRPVFGHRGSIYGLCMIEIIFTSMTGPGTLYKLFTLQKYGAYLSNPDKFMWRQVLNSIWNHISKSKLSDDELGEFFDVIFTRQLPENHYHTKFRKGLLSCFHYQVIFDLIRSDKIHSTFKLLNYLLAQNSELAKPIFEKNLNSKEGLGLRNRGYFYSPFIESLLKQMNYMKLQILDSQGSSCKSMLELIGRNPFNEKFRLRIKVGLENLSSINKDKLLYYQGLGMIRNHLLGFLGEQLHEQMDDKEAESLYRSITNWNFGASHFREEFDSFGMLKQLLFLEDKEKSLLEKSLQRRQIRFFTMIMATLDPGIIANETIFATLLHQVVFHAKVYEEQKMVSPFLRYFFSLNNPRYRFFVEFLKNRDSLGLTPLSLAEELGYQECQNYLVAIINTMNAKQEAMLHSDKSQDSWIVDFILSYCKSEWTHVHNGRQNIKGLDLEKLLADDFRKFNACAQRYSSQYPGALSLASIMGFYEPYFNGIVSMLKEYRPYLLKDINYLYQIICSDYALEFSRFQENKIKAVLSQVEP